LDDLDRSLQRLNSRLFVIRGQPAEKLPLLFKEWGTTCLTFEEDPGTNDTKKLFSHQSP
jgi:cryptochrome